MSIYESIIAAGFQTDHHESDLYVKATPEFREFMKKNHPNKSYTLFTSQIDGETWADLPFMYQPYWNKKLAR